MSAISISRTKVLSTLLWKTSLWWCPFHPVDEEHAQEGKVTWPDSQSKWVAEPGLMQNHCEVCFPLPWRFCPWEESTPFLRAHFEWEDIPVFTEACPYLSVYLGYKQSLDWTTEKAVGHLRGGILCMVWDVCPRMGIGTLRRPQWGEPERLVPEKKEEKRKKPPYFILSPCSERRCCHPFLLQHMVLLS